MAIKLIFKKENNNYINQSKRDDGQIVPSYYLIIAY